MARKSTEFYEGLTRIEESEARIQLQTNKGVLPLAISIELPGGYVSETVPAGVQFPFTTNKLFSTAGSFQLAAEFHVLIGNRPLSHDNMELCRIRVRNIKWSGAGVPQIDLKFDIDKEGLLTISAANLDRENAEIVVFMARNEVTEEEMQIALDDASAHEAEDKTTRALIQQMLDCYALIGTTNDYYSAAKKKMTHNQKTAYKQARKRLEKVLNVNIADATNETITELDAAIAAFRDQRQILLPLYKQVMDWYK